MAYRNKAYVCFDGDNDISYYRLMKAWHENENFDFTFYDAHDLMQARDSSSDETIKRSLRERLKNSREFIALIGENTKNLFKFVRWEMEVALNLDIPIIGVNLNGKNGLDSDRCPAIIRDELVVYVPYGTEPINYALRNWPDDYRRLKGQGDIGSHVYKNLGA